MELKFIVESLLFASQRPLTPRELRDVLNKVAVEQTPEGSDIKPTKVKEDEIFQALEALQREMGELHRSFRLICVAGAWQFVSDSQYAPWLKALLGEKNRPSRLTAPSLETLAIIAYRQPLTRAEMEQIRGVSVDGVMQTLIERGLVEAVGRAEVVGRPVTYGTTKLFLEYFGLASLEDLPAADELRKIVVQKPEQLLTADKETPGTEPTVKEEAPEGGAATPDAPAEAQPEPAAAEPAKEEEQS